MEEKLVTLAILTYAKAQILKNVLESDGIEAYIHNVNLIQPVISSGVRVRIKETDLPRALEIIESSAWLADAVVKEEGEKEDAEGKETPKILIPVDFSKYSMRACEMGFSFAKEVGAEVVLLHVYFSPIYIPGIPYTGDTFSLPADAKDSGRSLIETVHNDLNKLSDSIRQKMATGELPDVKYACKLREGIPEEEILRYAKNHDPLMIVMGTRGANQKDIELIGSVTAEVIERSNTLVYAIPEQSALKRYSEIRKIAFVTNFDQRDLIGFDKMIKVFQTHDIAFRFLHLTNDGNAWNEIKLAGIKEYFKKLYPKLSIEYDLIPEDQLLTNLDDYLKREQVDMLCLTNYKRNVFARLFNPGIARRMIFHANTPILVIK
jgi:nucleotide-binding universal stress UspA family protein